MLMRSYFLHYRLIREVISRCDSGERAVAQLSDFAGVILERFSGR
jgi:hypothetical protein